MNKIEISETTLAIIAAIGGWLTAALGWFKWWHELREKRIEKADKEKERLAKEKAEKELKDIKRRGDAPYLRPCDAVFNGVYFDNGNNNIGFIMPDNGALLSAFKQEVELEDGEGHDVIFLIENSGRTARAVTVKLDGEIISFGKEAAMSDAHGFQFLMYPYRKNLHGKEQTLSLSFESESGIQDTHQYLTKHGFRVLRRIDPILPQ